MPRLSVPILSTVFTSWLRNKMKGWQWDGGGLVWAPAQGLGCSEGGSARGKVEVNRDENSRFSCLNAYRSPEFRLHSESSLSSHPLSPDIERPPRPLRRYNATYHRV